MQDRFKFRLWDKSISEMSYDVCVGFIKDGTFPNDWICADTTCGQITYRGDKLKDICLMQCTGLKDKNGKLIYEGDIVKAKHKPDREGWYCVWRGVVEYNNKNCQYVIKASHYSVLNETKLNKATFENNESFIWFDWLEVIGNIYENPELLEVSNDH